MKHQQRFSNFFACHSFVYPLFSFNHFSKCLCCCCCCHKFLKCVRVIITRQQFDGFCCCCRCPVRLFLLLIRYLAFSVHTIHSVVVFLLLSFCLRHSLNWDKYVETSPQPTSVCERAEILSTLICCCHLKSNQFFFSLLFFFGYSIVWIHQNQHCRWKE